MTYEEEKALKGIENALFGLIRYQDWVESKAEWTAREIHGLIQATINAKNQQIDTLTSTLSQQSYTLDRINREFMLQQSLIQEQTNIINTIKEELAEKVVEAYENRSIDALQDWLKNLGAK